MGCWNATCFLTGLPIFHGQPAMLLFIAAQDDGTWLPTTLPIRGYYDDYGGLEDCETDNAALSLLRQSTFSANREDMPAGRIFDTAGFYARDWEESLKELATAAVRGELSQLVTARNVGTSEWRRARVLMAHPWAWNHLVDAIPDVQDDLLSSVTFRLKTNGALRTKLRDMSNDGPLAESDPTAPGIVRLAKLMAAMDAMRIAFHPANGDGSQDDMSDDWQLQFQKKRFLHAIAIPHRYDEYEQAPFSAAAAWDGEALVTDRNNGAQDYPDLPEGTSPHCLWARMLGKCLDNVLSAMDEATKADEG